MNKLGIIVPYRDRINHLKKFIPHLKKFLNDLDNTIVIVEQNNNKPFNRGKLINIGFNYLINNTDISYVGLHDIDMLPIDADYSYVDTPTHIASLTSQFGYKLPYQEYFGGVTLFNINDFITINGFNNDYWGWGGEDDDLYHRCNLESLKIQRRNCRFESLPHIRTNNNHSNYENNIQLLNDFRYGKIDHKKNGLNTVKYDSFKLLNEKDYIRISVDL